MIKKMKFSGYVVLCAALVITMGLAGCKTTAAAATTVAETTAETTAAETAAATTVAETTAANAETSKGYGYTFYSIDIGSSGDPNFTVMDNGAAKAAEDFGVKVIVSHGEGDNAKAVSFMEAAISAKPNGIAVNIADATAYNDVVMKALNAGIPVIAFNQNANTKLGLAYIGADLTKDGYDLGKNMQKYFKKGDHIVIPEEVPGMYYAVARSDGIKKAMDEIGVTYEELDAGYDPAKTVSLISAYIEGHPNTKGILNVGGLTTDSSVVAIQDLKLESKIIIGGYDFLPNTLTGLKSGLVKVSMDQQLFLQTYLAITQLVLVNYAKFATMDVNTAKGMVTPENVGAIEPLIKEHIR